jgi:predicted RNA-binding protein (virulence factor B family)
MIEIGRYNKLTVNKILPHGAYLDAGEEYDEILLPTRYLPKETELGDELRVFIYRDSEDLLIATTEEPKAIVGDIVVLKCIQVNAAGAFLDWGLMKDLLVPFREQKYPMEEGKKYLVKVYYDEVSQRIVASSKLLKFIDNEEIDVAEGDEVELMVSHKTDMGYSVIINDHSWGLLYANEVFRPLYPGNRMRGYVTKIREGNKIDVSLQKKGYDAAIPDMTMRLLFVLKENNGFLPLTDKTEPEKLYELLQMSKKNFKKAAGALYREKKITIEDEGIRLV